jgi:beta-glucosidase
MVLLKNEELLPLKKGTRVYAEGMLHPETLNKYGRVVNTPEEADVILLRLHTPYDERNKYFLERFFHQGRLWYTGEELQKILGLITKKPSVVVVNLERPAILTPVNEKCGALMADFGASGEVIAGMLFGKYNPSGKLPFELPSSKEAVEKQKEDVPYDSENPLYPFGYGISYEE